MYVAYLLNFSDNISIERALKMSKDKQSKETWKTDGGWNESYTHKDIINWRVKSHLKDFWNAQGLKTFSRPDEVFDFFEKYCKRRKSRWYDRILMWLRQ